MQSILKNDLVRAFSQSMGVYAAADLVNEKIRLAGLEDKEQYSVEELLRVTMVLIRLGGLVGVIAQAFTNRILRQLQEEAEQRAITTEKESEEIFGSVNVGIVLVDRDSQEIVDINTKALLVIGYLKHEVLHHPCGKIYGGSHIATDLDLAPGESMENLESEIITRSGHRLPILLSVKAIKYKGNSCLLESFVDITPIKEVEQELRDARQRAEAASRSKTQFLANMSHEIRTPMNGVLGMAELLSKSDLNDRQRRFVEVIHSSGESLVGIINDILDISKLEAGKLVLETIDFDLYRITEDVVESFFAQSQRKQIEVGCLIDPRVPRGVHGDPGRIRQILTNLVGNAIKFTDKGQVLVRVSVAGGAEEVPLFRFEVQDSGTGIAPQARVRIFEEFSQADGSTTRRHGGTGLGLAIAKQLVEIMGGHIGVESAQGNGATFWFTIPLKEELSHSQRVPIPERNLESLQVLVAGGNHASREILEAQLKGWGFNYKGTADGDEALETLKRAAQRGDPCKLAILDTNLPGTAALQLARAIKADPIVADVPLILLCSMGLPGDAEEAGQTGISAYLTKPVRPSELYNCIATVMGWTAGKKPSQVTTYHSRSPGGSGFSARILLAEDTLLNQEVAREMIESLGCSVDIVKDGRNALKAVSDNQYDLVFMDCQMPEMDGYDATRMIRKKEEQETASHHLPIVALTAHAMEGDREKCLEAGMNDYICKPFKLYQLRRVLEHWLPWGPRARSGSEVLPGKAAARNQLRRVEDDPGELTDRASTPSDSGADGIDIKALNNIRALQKEGSPDIVSKMIGIYLKESPKFLQSIRHAILTGDADSMKRVAHSFKSNSANVGASAVVRLCKRIENMEKASFAENALTLLSEIEAEYGKARSTLARKLQKE